MDSIWLFSCLSRRGLDRLDRLDRGRSERRLVRADAGRGPRVVGRGTATARSALRRGSGGGPRVVGGSAAALLPPAVRRAALPLGARHLGGGVLQRGADL